MTQVLAGALLIYYFLLDRLLAGAALAFVVPLLYAGHRLALDLAFAQSAAIALYAFLGGCSFQLAGHAIEGRRPAVLDNLFQVFIAPIFVVAELLFALGLRHDLRDSVRLLTGMASGTPRRTR